MPRKFSFGLTPWGSYFIDAMERLADEARLGRGRSYAGHGYVLKLSIKDGKAEAMVEGSYRPWYNVTIAFKPLGRGDIEAIYKLIDNDPMLMGRIAAGELPLELIERLEKANIQLLPSRWEDMRRSCTCPDYGDPCKHMAAVYYILAQEIDRDPSVLFRLRGVELAGRFGKMDAKHKERAGRIPNSAAIPDPLAIKLIKPWTMPANTTMPSLPKIDAYGEALAGLLPAPPPLVPYDLKKALAGFYRDVGRRWDLLLGPRLSSERGEAEARALSQAKVSVLFPDADSMLVGSNPSILIEASGEKARRLSPLDAVRLCLASEQEEGSAGYNFLRAFSFAMRMIVASGAFVPDVRFQEPVMRVVWKPAQFGADVRTLLEVVAGLAAPPSIKQASHRPSTKAKVEAKRENATPAKTKVPDPHSTMLALTVDFLSRFVAELRYLPDDVSDISHPVTADLFRGEAADVSSPLHRSLPKAMDSWLSVFDIASSEYNYELEVKHLAQPASDRDTSNQGLRYALSATVRQPTVDGKAARRISLSTAAKRLGPEVLTFPALLSAFVPELAGLGTKTSIALGEAALSRFVIGSASLLGRLGVTLGLPKELRTLLRPRPVLTAKKRKGSGNLVSFMDVASMLSFEWRVSIGDEVLSVEEFERMVKAGTALVRFRDGYIRLEASEAASLLERIRKGPKPDAYDALKEYLAGEARFDEALERNLASLFSENGTGKDIILPSGLRATLRPYQERGFRWAISTLARGFGCILADDMGLGKTIQAIACVLHLKETGALGRGALVCAPATLLTNWERELERFAPALTVSMYYGASRRKKAPDAILTSYETFLRDQKKLEGNEWDIVILDEAHLIKNPDAKRSKAVKSIVASRRLALSGTPVENHLGEFWSIFDFTMPGYLRTLERFNNDFRKPIEVDRSEETAARLRRIAAPFLMRRLKTDKTIIADLPEKIVADEYAVLVPEQAALYESVVREYMMKIEMSEGIERRGLILALITALKQVCNHPRNFDKDSEPSVERSGKTRLLVAILDAALEAGEKVLVFSQYVEMLEILRGIIQRDLGVEPFILHGKLTAAKRNVAVDSFRSSIGPGIFLISLKAGGLGLNLTEATRVIHYDLWFNPAVENQATDRAFRIGQRRNVFVHRLITKDSFEEKIDATLRSKRELADLAVSAGETWLTELNNAELSALVSR